MQVMVTFGLVCDGVGGGAVVSLPEAVIHEAAGQLPRLLTSVRDIAQNVYHLFICNNKK